jgi:cobalamin-dependent methionine synthase I
VECRAAIRDLIAQARRHGFTKEEIVIDLSPGEAVPQPEAVRTTLDLISWCADDVRCRTLLDVTGIGRGLPERQWIQAAVLAAAQAAGLTLAIADPALKELMQIRAAGDLLRGNDHGGAAWRARFA